MPSTDVPGLFKGPEASSDKEGKGKAVGEPEEGKEDLPIHS